MANPVNKSHAIGALVIGALEILFALIIMICSFVVGGKMNASASLTPYWAGIPYIVPGILGVVVGLTKNYCAMIAFMVLNIICFVIMGVSALLIVLVISIYSAVAKATNCTYNYGLCTCNTNGRSYTYKVANCGTLSSILSLLYAIMIFAVLAAIASLAGSIIACAATCCRGNQQPGTVIVQQPVMMQANQPPAYGQPQGFQQQQQQQAYPQKA